MAVVAQFNFVARINAWEDNYLGTIFRGPILALLDSLVTNKHNSVLKCALNWNIHGECHENPSLRKRTISLRIGREIVLFL